MNGERRMLSAGLVALALHGFSGHAGAAEKIHFAHLSVEDGLSQTSVEAILQDRRGFMWLGTQEGLNRFDGREFLHFFSDEENPQSLAHNWIWALHEDTRGRIWIGTDGGGLDRLDPDTGTITHFRHSGSDPATIGGDVVRDIVEDAQGRLWIGTDGGGISRIGADDTVVRLGDLSAGAALSHTRVRVLHLGPGGFIWVGTDGGGVARLDPETGAVVHVELADHPSVNRVRALASRGDQVWVGTYEGGLLRLDSTSGKVTQFRHDPGDPRSLSGNSVRSLFVDAAGTLWVGTDGAGLNEFVSDTGGFRRHRHDATDPASLADDHVVELAQDRGGVIWIGTYRGTSRWNPALGTFTRIARHGDAPGQLSDNYVTSFAETDDGAVWVGTYGGGVNRWNPERTAFEHLTHDPSDASTLADNRVFALAADGDRLWIGTRGGGLNGMDLRTGRVRRYLPDPERDDSLSADGITSILRDSRGTLWVGTFVAGLNRLDDADKGTFTRYRHRQGDASSLCSDRVLALTESTSGDIWVGTYGGGLCRLDPANGAFTTYRHDPADPHSLSSDRAWSLHEDAAGNLWIGTQDGGLNRWPANERRAGRVRFTRFGRDHGLGNRAVFAVESDSRGHVWFSTSRGLAELEPDAGVIRRYDVTRGLQSNEFNHNASGQTRGGELMFGGIAGFNVFQPETIRINQHAPQIALTRITRLNEPLGMPLASWAGRELEFTHEDVLISFEYAALDFTAPTRNRYRHRLVGFESEWVDDGITRRATYTNLAPGQYTFEVKAANGDGVWVETPLGLQFAVLPPPWATWWARSIYVLLALLVAALLYRAHARRLAIAAHIQETNEALRAEIARREEQQRALVVAKEQAQRYLDVVEVIILSLDESGTIRLVNQKSVRVLGYPEEELIGRNFYEDLVPPGAREALRARFADVQDHVYSESPVLARDGTERLIAWHAVSLPGTDDQAPGLLISGADLTQERALERQVREAQKMEALGTLSRGIAHDFNNILGAILGFAELLRGQVAPGSKAAGYLQDLELSVERARNLIKAILAFGRQARQEPVPTRVQSLVEEALQLLRPTVPPHIEIVSRCDETAPPVLADPTQLHQLVMNLATNAVQAMDEQGGTLALEVAKRDVSLEEARTRSHLCPGAHVELIVQDTGPGMDDFTRARMFEPFFTTKGPSRGTGLGLSVVHGLVTQMGGDIDVGSQPGRGTRISIILPACSSEPAAPEAQATDDNGLPRGTETVMLVDDEPVLVEIGRAMLGPLGYQVLGAGGGTQALRELESRGDVDLVVTDQNMPGMTGLALARAIRAAHPHVPVILVTGAHDASVDDSAFDATLDKPFRLRDLACTVRDVLDRVN